MEPEIIKLIGYAIVTVLILLSIWHNRELYVSNYVDPDNEDTMNDK